MQTYDQYSTLSRRPFLLGGVLRQCSGRNDKHKCDRVSLLLVVQERPSLTGIKDKLAAPSKIILH
jgi:hypothetical protein